MFKDTIGTPDVMLCLDCGSISPQIFGLTTTLRGCITVDLSVRVLKAGIHSGLGSGVVPSSFRVARKILDRIENSDTGVLIDKLQVSIPDDKMQQAVLATKIFGDKFWYILPFADGVKSVTDDALEIYLNNAWKSQLEVIGQSGIPDIAESGNVLREETLLRISIRLAPTLPGEEVYLFSIIPIISIKIMKEICEIDPPYNAQVKTTLIDSGDGWSAHTFPEIVSEMLNKIADEIFNAPACMIGAGGSIPFIKVLQDHLPKTLLVVSGVVLPDSSIHGPDECLHLGFLEKFSHSLAGFLVDYSEIRQGPVN